VVASAIHLMDEKDLVVGGNRYRFIDGQVKARTPFSGSDFVELDPVHHKMDEILLVSPPAFVLAA
jgi:hypothetical protein